MNPFLENLTQAQAPNFEELNRNRSPYHSNPSLRGYRNENTEYRLQPFTYGKNKRGNFIIPTNSDGIVNSVDNKLSINPNQLYGIIFDDGSEMDFDQAKKWLSKNKVTPEVKKENRGTWEQRGVMSRGNYVDREVESAVKNTLADFVNNLRKIIK